MLANRVIAKRWKAVALIGAGVLATMVACESRLPNDAVEEEQALVEQSQSAPRKAEGTAVPDDGNIVLTGPDAMALIDKYYPTELRKAGVGGFAVVNLTVHENGRVDGHTIARSTGNQELDATALRIAKELKMLPTLRDPKPGPQEYNLVLTFDPEMKLRRLAPTKQPFKTKGDRLPDTGAVVAPSELERKPIYTPYDVRPELANREEVVKALRANYPPVLRDAGITGKALVWLLVNADGTVAKAEVKDGSGRVELDQAAVNVAKVMKFTPASNKGIPVPVWIQLPIVFLTQ